MAVRDKQVGSRRVSVAACAVCAARAQVHQLIEDLRQWRPRQGETGGGVCRRLRAVGCPFACAASLGCHVRLGLRREVGSPCTPVRTKVWPGQLTELSCARVVMARS
jgi:hypothetical protein